MHRGIASTTSMSSLLLEIDPPDRPQEKRTYSSILHAIEADDVAAVEQLIKQGSDINVRRHLHVFSSLDHDHSHSSFNHALFFVLIFLSLLLISFASRQSMYEIISSASAFFYYLVISLHSSPGFFFFLLTLLFFLDFSSSIACCTYTLQS